MTIKEQLKGTCVLNESEEMGAEIVALYTKAGFENLLKLKGKGYKVYYGEENGDVSCWDSPRIFKSVLTLSQLREIVKGKQEKPYFKIDYSDGCTAEQKQEIEKMLIESSKKVFVNASEGIAQPISEPQFKAGDMVEGRVDIWTIGIWSDETVLFTGGKTKEGLFICEYNDGELASFNEIRHPKDKDKEKAEEIVDAYLCFGESEQDQEAKRVTVNAVESGIKWERE